MRRLWLTCAALLCLAPLAARADEERTLTDPTGWWWLYNVTATQINDLVNNDNARLIDVEVQSESPLRFAAAFVHNSGVHARGWWWYYGLTTADITTYINQNNGRLIDIERYDSGGQTRFAVVMVANTGSAAKGWWWYFGVTTAQIGTYATHNNARLVDLEWYDAGGGTIGYDCIMIANTGADASGWWWYYNVDAATLGTLLATNNARLLDLDVRDGATGRFDAVMIPNSGASAVAWWWYYGITATQIAAFVDQNGARLIDIEPYLVSGLTRYAVVMINNSNELTTAVASQLGYGADGATGLYLKRVGGAVLASLQPSYVFEPASTIKVIHHLHAMRQVMFGSDDLDNDMTWSNAYSGSCPIGGAPFVMTTLGETLRLMMQNSDNAATQAIRARFGEANINNTAATVALMTDTDTNHTLGCAGDEVANPNHMTLLDAASLYERVADGTILDDATRETFWSLMQSETTAGPWWFTTDLHDVVDEEAAALGMPQVADSYWANVRLAWKPGGYTINGREYRAVAGWVSLPVCPRIGVVPSHREYVFGLFIDDADDGPYADTRLRVTKELFRGEIRAGLLTCPSGAPEALASLADVRLEPAWPNPFNPRATIAFSLPEPGHARLTVHDLRGRAIAVLVDDDLPAGRLELPWDGRDDQGALAAAGVYFLRLETEGSVQTQKVSLIK